MDLNFEMCCVKKALAALFIQNEVLEIKPFIAYDSSQFKNQEDIMYYGGFTQSLDPPLIIDIFAKDDVYLYNGKEPVLFNYNQSLVQSWANFQGYEIRFKYPAWKIHVTNYLVKDSNDNSYSIVTPIRITNNRTAVVKDLANLEEQTFANVLSFFEDLQENDVLTYFATTGGEAPFYISLDDAPQLAWGNFPTVAQCRAASLIKLKEGLAE